MTRQPVWFATLYLYCIPPAPRCIFAHASRAGGDARRLASLDILPISTHASRAGGDSKKQQKNPLLFSHSKSFLFHSVNHQAIPSIL